MKQTARSLSLPSVIFILKDCLYKDLSGFFLFLKVFVLPGLPINLILHCLSKTCWLFANKQLVLEKNCPVFVLASKLKLQRLILAFCPQVPTTAFSFCLVLFGAVDGAVKGFAFFLQNLKSRAFDHFYLANHNCKDLFWLFAFKCIAKFHAVEIKTS